MGAVAEPAAESAKSAKEWDKQARKAKARKLQWRNIFRLILRGEKVGLFSQGMLDWRRMQSGKKWAGTNEVNPSKLTWLLL